MPYFYFANYGIQIQYDSLFGTWLRFEVRKTTLQFFNSPLLEHRENTRRTRSGTEPQLPLFGPAMSRETLPYVESFNELLPVVPKDLLH